MPVRPILIGSSPGGRPGPGAPRSAVSRTFALSFAGSLVAGFEAEGQRQEAALMGSLVLVVEDERKVRELLRRYLERAGLEVLTTESGAEAITLAAQARPDLVVLDLGLPDVPGDVVARRAAPRRPRSRS